MPGGVPNQRESLRQVGKLAGRLSQLFDEDLEVTGQLIYDMPALRGALIGKQAPYARRLGSTSRYVPGGPN